MSRFRIRNGLLVAVAVAAATVASTPAAASAASTTKTVSYHGYRMVVPASWPVFRVSASSSVCVRFNRDAVYLGVPGQNQSCPPAAVGRGNAILVEPLSAGRYANAPGVRLVDRRHGVSVTATWGSNPAAVRRALGVRSLSSLPSASVPAKPAPLSKHALRPATTTPAASPGAVFQGLGFDACTAPSETVMSAWGVSSYRAVGIYIGGPEQGCAQPNLTSTWVTDETAAGWHLIPIYVGPQAPSNTCGCTVISGRNAVAQGEAAANDAAIKAQALGIGTGNPIYYDMEGYTRNSKNTSRVLNFLQAWTGALRAHGYLAGVYSSTGSGITDLVAKYGGSYLEPDEIWFAHWDGQQSVTDPVLPSTTWTGGRRLHQYKGAHNETHGHKKLNVDSNYLDGATAAAGTGPAVAVTAPSTKSGPSITGKHVVGQMLTEHHAPWTEWPYNFTYQWQRCDHSGCTSVPGATGPRYKLHKADAHKRLRVLETAGNFIGTSKPVGSAISVSTFKNPFGYWMFSASGHVWTSRYQLGHGSRSAGGAPIVGMASTPDGRGYWLAASDGTAYAYGDATQYPRTHHGHPIIGIVADPTTGGYWLYTSYGNVYAVGGARFHGSMASKHVHVRTVVGMAPSSNGLGYWLVTRPGAIYAFGGAPHQHRIKHRHPIIGIQASAQGGFWLYTAYGNVYSTPGAHMYGSPVHRHVHVSNITGMLTTPNRRGYWIVTADGRVMTFGNARGFKHPWPKAPVVGLAGP